MQSANDLTSKRRWQAVKDFFYGLTGYEFVHHAREMRHEAESIFLVVTLGDLVGIPVMPPVYALRLLPFVAPGIAAWKRQLARRKEFWEKEEYDLHGV
ncbi:MAG: hypothetical protein Q8S00_24590 [Deltaproteobacteria bacterium]|nr:hypothetical protein [Deltaproteobacteria bacterium]MDZ4345708.1 hypothetical protein [Candidatus Binatia bacterium]